MLPYLLPISNTTRNFMHHTTYSSLYIIRLRQYSTTTPQSSIFPFPSSDKVCRCLFLLLKKAESKTLPKNFLTSCSETRYKEDMDKHGSPKCSCPEHASPKPEILSDTTTEIVDRPESPDPETLENLPNIKLIMRDLIPNFTRQELKDMPEGTVIGPVTIPTDLELVFIDGHAEVQVRLGTQKILVRRVLVPQLDDVFDIDTEVYYKALADMVEANERESKEGNVQTSEDKNEK
ncbi:hypothetical protein F4819DRAFT_12497 [Hypoxylon fuscum]|nr:hypothetical protein F4819DRAFT_12497 [Hypoxylon fuscum]